MTIDVDRKNTTVATSMGSNAYLGLHLLGEFDERKESWTNYQERVEQFISLNDVESTKQVSLLITHIGARGYGILKNLVAPDSPKDCTYAKLTKALSDHFCPKPLKYAERYKYGQRDQREGESVNDFVASIRKLSINCEYGSFLNDMLIQRLLEGTYHPSIRKRLMLEENLTFNKAVEIANSIEQANANCDLMQKTIPQGHGQAVHSVQNRSQNSSRFYQQQQSYRPRKRVPCNHCGKTNHASHRCRLKNAVCNKCQRRGHIAAACPSSNNSQVQQRGSINIMKDYDERDDGDYDGNDYDGGDDYEETNAPQKYNNTRVMDNYKVKHSNFTNDSSMTNSNTLQFQSLDFIGIDQVQHRGFSSKDTVCHMNIFERINPKTDAFVTNIHIDGTPCEMEIDTGSKYSLMSEQTFCELFPGRKLSPTNIKLKTYSGEKLSLRGFRSMNITVDGVGKRLRLYVLSNEGPTLLGRDWIRAFNQTAENSQADLNRVTTTTRANHDDDIFKSRIDSLVNEYEHLFSGDLGTLKGVKGTLYLKEGATPKFCKARNVPFAIRGRVEDAIDRMVDSNMMYSVAWSRWASPVVPVIKKDGSVRLCGDFKQTLNPCLNQEQYPLPKIDDIFATLAGGKYFAKLDLRQAYLQMAMDENSQELLTISTHKGLYRPTRMLYGVNSAPAIWQRAMEQVIRGLSNVQVILDDMIVSGNSKENFLNNLESLFSRLHEHGLKLNREKCKFYERKVEYCGHIIDERGLHKNAKQSRRHYRRPTPH